MAPTDNGPGSAGEAPAGAVAWPFRSLRSSVLVASALVVLLCLPFVEKAFHIDDPAFLNLSRMIGWNPLHALPVDYDYGGRVIPNLLPYEITHPLLVPYYIKIVQALFGESEVALHLAFLVFPLIAVGSLMTLHASLFPGTSERNLLLGVAFCTLPAFLVNAQNVMTDVPFVAFLLLGVSVVVAGVERGQPWRTWAGGFALTLAVFTSYQAVAFVPLLLLFALWRGRLTASTAGALLLPVAFLAAWLVAVYSLYDVFPLLKSKIGGFEASVGDELRKGLAARLMIYKSVSVLAFIGASMVFVLPFHYGLRRQLLRVFLPTFVSLTGIAYLATSPLTRYAVFAQLALSAFVALGLLTLITVCVTAWSRVRRGAATGTRFFLLVWVFGVAAYCIVLFPFSAARYVLPAYPPILMLLLDDPAWHFTTRARRVAVTCILSASVLLALASSISDYRYAETYRDFATSVASTADGSRGNATTWYIGEWGMHYYMDRAGARYLYATSTEPVRGDLVVIPEMPRFWTPAPQLRARLAPRARRVYASPVPLRLFNARSHAGFYAQFIGMLPFAVSGQPDEVFQVYEVVR